MPVLEIVAFAWPTEICMEYYRFLTNALDPITTQDNIYYDHSIFFMLGEIKNDKDSRVEIKSVSVNNKVDVQFPHILVRKRHTQACKIVAGTKRKLCKKFQVDICKTKKKKKNRSAHAQLRTL